MIEIKKFHLKKEKKKKKKKNEIKILKKIRKK